MKILIVGLGSMGKRRARLIRGIDPAIGVCGVDFSAERRAEAEGLGIKSYESIAAAICAESFDAAFVSTAPKSHAAVIGALLDAGLSVFTEINLISDGYAENMQKAKERGVLLFLSSTMLYRGETQFIKKEVAAFAKPVSYLYHIGQYLPDWHPWENYKNFFVGDKRTGGCREIFGIELPWLMDA
ncbi:MAG: Gfo/Idh/MocA family oxidoreductase, partial [Pygmaiobacter sp.]